MCEGMMVLAGECRAWLLANEHVSSASWHQAGPWTLTWAQTHEQTMWEEALVCGQFLPGHGALSSLLSFGL